MNVVIKISIDMDSLAFRAGRREEKIAAVVSEIVEKMDAYDFSVGNYHTSNVNYITTADATIQEE